MQESATTNGRCGNCEYNVPEVPPPPPFPNNTEGVRNKETKIDHKNYLGLP